MVVDQGHVQQPRRHDRYEAIPQVNEFVAGHAAEATRTGYRWALDEGLIAGDPAGNVRRTRRPSDPPRAALSRTELKDWLDVAEAEGGHV